MRCQNAPNVRLGKSLEITLQGRPFSVGGTTVSRQDSLRLANAFTLWLLVIQDAAEVAGLERVYSDTNVQRCARQLAGCDAGIVQQSCKALLDAVRLWSPIMGNQSFKAYKALLLQPEVDPLTTELLWPLMTCYYRSNCDTSLFREVNSVLQFWTRLTLKDVDWIEDEMIDAYVSLESEMEHWSYDDAPGSTVDELRRIATNWMLGWTPWGAKPSHSNGATAEVRRGKGIAAKWRAMKLYANHEMLSAFTGYGSHPLKSGYLSGFCNDASKYSNVPKGVDRKRGINMEPTGNMFWQHAGFSSLEDWFNKHPEMGISLRNQERSAIRCLIGSLKLKYATIDLSSASDTVTWKLIQLLLRGTPLLTFLHLCRTKVVEIPGRGLVRLNKFAPMGSALCFPMECLVFAAIACLACKRAGCRLDFYVYGDDIIVPAEAYHHCVEILNELHFTVNESKSFGPYSDFLESCGMEAKMGHDVSPCRLPRRYDVVQLRKQSPTQLEGSIELANRLYEYGYSRARKYLIADILQHYAAVPFSVNPELGIYHPNPTNMHLQSRPSNLYTRKRGTSTLVRGGVREHRAQYKIVRCVSVEELGPDEVRYQVCLEGMETDREPRYLSISGEPLWHLEDMREPVRVGSTRVKLSYTWVDQDRLERESGFPSQ